MLRMYVSVFNVGVIWLCVKIWGEKTVTSVDTHLPSACTHTNIHKHTDVQTHAHPPFPRHKAVCEDIDITTLSTTSAQEKLVGEISLSSLRKERK